MVVMAMEVGADVVDMVGAEGEEEAAAGASEAEAEEGVGDGDGEFRGAKKISDSCFYSSVALGLACLTGKKWNSPYVRIQRGRGIERFQIGLVN